MTSVARFTGQDLAFLGWESPRRPMHVALRIDFLGADLGRVPSLDELRSLFAALAHSEPLLCSRLLRRGVRRLPKWTRVDALRIEEHVREVEVPEVASAQASLDAVLRAPLHFERPLWEVWLLRDTNDSRDFSLLIKIHHVLIDGVAGMALLERLLGGSGRAPRCLPAGASLSPGAEARAGWRRTLRFAREHLRRSPRSPLNGAAAPRRFHLLEIDAAAFDAAAARLPGTPNDVVLGCVSGALRRWLTYEMGSAAPRSLRAFCPVNLRRPSEAGGTGNRISPWLVPLPLNEPKLRVRVERITAHTRAMRRRGEQLGGEGLARWIARLGTWVAKLGMAIAAWRRSYSIVVSNLPGPPQPLELLGARSARLFAFPPLFAGQRVAIAIIRHGGRLFWGVTDGLPDAASGRRLCEDLASELSAVAACRGVGEHAA